MQLENGHIETGQATHESKCGLPSVHLPGIRHFEKFEPHNFDRSPPAQTKMSAESFLTGSAQQIQGGGMKPELGLKRPVSPAFVPRLSRRPKNSSSPSRPYPRFRIGLALGN
jgi:hypothetical protein